MSWGPDHQKQFRRTGLFVVCAFVSGKGRYSRDADRGGDPRRVFRGRHPLSTGSNSDVKRILLIGLRTLGDVVLTTGAIPALKELFPEARIDYLTRAPFDVLLSEEPGISRAFSLPPRKFGPLTFGPYLRFLWTIRRANYDLVIDFFSRGPRSRVITLFSGADRRIGLIDRNLDVHRWVDWLIYTLRVCPPVQLALTRDRIPYLISRIGRLKHFYLPSLTVTEDDLSSARTLLREEGIPEERFWIIFCGSGAQAKNWPAENFAKISEHLAEEGFYVLCLGGISDRDQQEAFRKSFETLPSQVRIRTQISWKALKGVCRLSRGVLSNDSGPAHIAQAVGTPALVLFGPGDHVSYAPFIGSFLKADLECQPCQSFAVACPDNQCMKLIEIGRVWEEMQKFPVFRQPASASGSDG